MNSYTMFTNMVGTVLISENSQGAQILQIILEVILIPVKQLFHNCTLYSLSIIIFILYHNKRKYRPNCTKGTGKIVPHPLKCAQSYYQLCINKILLTQIFISQGNFLFLLLQWYLQTQV